MNVYLVFIISYYIDSKHLLSPLYLNFLENPVCSNNPTPERHSDKEHSFLKVYYLNARSLVNKIDLLRSYTATYRPHVVCISETWGNDNLPDKYFSIKDYVFYRCDRQGIRGGGVGIYISSQLQSYLLSSFASDRVEGVTCCIRGSERNCIISCIYKPPDYRLCENDSFIEYMYSVSGYQQNAHLIICGDFNSPNIQWDSPTLSQFSDPLLTWYLDNFLNQNINFPTRPQSASILDLVFSSMETEVSEISINECFGSSDHAIISFKICFDNFDSDTKYSHRMCFSQANWTRFRKILLNANWKNAGDDNIDNVWTTYFANISNAIEQSIPKKEKVNWSPLNNVFLQSKILQHRENYEAYVELPSLDKKLNCLRSQKNIDSTIENLIRSHEEKLSKNAKSNPKAFWSYVGQTFKKSPSMFSTIKDFNGECIFGSLEIAEAFNDLFCSHFNCQNYSINKQSEDASNAIPCLEYISFTSMKVLQFIRNLPSSVSTDKDGICYTILKQGNLLLAIKLASLFELSMNSGSLPQSWNSVTVTPIYKSGDKCDLHNYRPIGVSSCVLRLMERMIADEMHTFIDLNMILNNTQHGFIRGGSIETANIVFYDFVTKNLDAGKCVDVIYLDFSRAFDSVPHELLISKLFMFGIRGKLLKWISAYLTHRTQSVIINGKLSQQRKILSGVIQGSVLGPLLFSLFINDIDQCIDDDIMMIKYADDVKMAVSFRSNIEDSGLSATKLQKAINSIECWSVKNGLYLNVTKSKSIQFGINNPLLQYTCYGVDIERVHCFKDLGIIVNEPFSFDMHVSNIVLKANRILGILSKTIKTKTPAILLPLYKSYVRSILEYGSILWSPHKMKSVHLIERVQRRFTKMFPNLRHLEYQQRLRKLSLLSLSARRTRYKLIFLFKVLNQATTIHPSDHFVFSNRAQRGNPRKLLMPNVHHNFRSNFFVVDCIHHWNSLTFEESSAGTLQQFKKSIESYFVRINIW